MRWKEKGRRQKVGPGQLAKVDMERFAQNRSRLLTFVAREPGAMTAHFLAQIRQRLKGPAGRITHTDQLRDISAVTWVGISGLTETRDLREANTLAAILDAVNRKEIAEALDVLVMRLHAITKAKEKGGSWDKASKLELIQPVGGDMLPAGLSGLAA